jgi:glyoxylase-like metal-dependent hydrolase (beta-lactamase superfamily II)
LPYCGGITVINTPGHTPGHISLYHKPSKTLIAGDAMIVADGRLLGPNPQYTLDMKTAIESLKKLMQYDIETVICYHGGLYKDNANRRIAELAKG